MSVDHPVYCADCGEICYPLEDDFVCPDCGWSQNEYLCSAVLLPLTDIKSPDFDFIPLADYLNGQILDSKQEFSMNKVTSSKLLGLLKSRKFWAALIGLVFVFLGEFVPSFPFTAEQITNVVYMMIAYIIGVAIDDAGQGIGGSKPF